MSAKQIPPHPSEENNNIREFDRDIIHVPPRFGACVDRITGVERCALAPSSCEPREDYVGSHITSKVCGKDDVLLGRCQDGQRCAPSQDACDGGAIESNEFHEFPSAGGHCTLMKDTIDTTTTGSALKATAFPSCQDDHHRCVIDSSYCRPGENVQQASTIHNNHNQCFCQDVKIGLCYEQGLKTNEITPENSYCAVSNKDCPIHSHRYLEGFHVSLMNCRLCDITSDREELVGACVDEEMVGSQKKVNTKCVASSRECAKYGRSIYLTVEELLSLHGMYCPASQVAETVLPTPFPTRRPTTTTTTPAPVPITTFAPKPTTRPTNKPTPVQQVTRTSAPVSTTTTTTTFVNPNEETMMVPSAEDEQQLTNASIYWIVIAVLIVFGMLISLLGSYCWHRKQQRKNNNDAITMKNANETFPLDENHNDASASVEGYFA